MNLTGGMKEVHSNLGFLYSSDYITHLFAAGNIRCHYINSNATDLTVYLWPEAGGKHMCIIQCLYSDLLS